MSVTIEDYMVSIDLDYHPLMMMKNRKIKNYYYLVLEDLMKERFDEGGVIKGRLERYKEKIVLSNFYTSEIVLEIEKKKARKYFSRLWRRKYIYWFITDVAMISINKLEIYEMIDDFMEYFSFKSRKKIELFINGLDTNDIDNINIKEMKVIIEQYRKNLNFIKKDKNCYVVTGTVSSGKSTFINALVGKRVSESSQEVCTDKIHLIYDKAFEDKHTIFFEKLELKGLKIAHKNVIGTCTKIKLLNEPSKRILVVDTPGINSALNLNHSKLTKKILKNLNYKKVFHILDATKLGNSEQMEYINWIVEHVDNNKIIFIINKIDTFKKGEDNIEESLRKLNQDLKNMGVKKPKIYTTSSYFGLLLKIEESTDTLTEDEEDDYDLYLKKLSRNGFNYSTVKNSKDNDNEADETEYLKMLKKSGLYAIEQEFYN